VRKSLIVLDVYWLAKLLRVTDPRSGASTYISTSLIRFPAGKSAIMFLWFRGKLLKSDYVCNYRHKPVKPFPNLRRCRQPGRVANPGDANLLTQVW
jgi:hypothetical protein